MVDTDNDFSATLPAAWLLTEPPGDLCQPVAPPQAGHLADGGLRGTARHPRAGHRRARAALWGTTAGGMLGLLRHWASGAAR